VAYLCVNLYGEIGWALVVVVPATVQAAAAVYLNDLFLAGLIAFFLVSLHRSSSKGPVIYLAAASLGLVREAGAFVAVVAAAVLWVRKDRRHSTGIAAAALGSWLLADRVLAPSGTNIHGLPGFVYFMARWVSSALRNIAGFQIWTESLAALWSSGPGRGGCVQPVFRLHLPDFLNLGQVGSLGLCPWEPGQILTFLLVYTTTLGLVPTVLLLYWRRLPSLVRFGPVTVSIASATGMAIFLLAPFNSYGAAIARILLYGAPGLAITSAFLLKPLLPRIRPPRRLILALAHVGLLALSAMYLKTPLTVGAITAALALALAIHGGAARLLAEVVRQENRCAAS
jgi:hypothetical protein